jgi:cytochrome oxidase Cu insertion factor (SCO1/SenC/PrrC family)
MSWKLIRNLCIPAFALFLTFKIYVWFEPYLNKAFTAKDSTSSGEASIGGKFILVNQDGKMVADSDFKGKLMLVYFGFTNCPDTCPLDLALITKLMEKLGDNAKNVQPIFITVDPARDTTGQLKQYLSNFYPGMIGLTGTKGQIADIIAKYHIFSKKSEVVQNADHEEESHQHEEEGHGDSHEHHEHGGYAMEHSSYIYLMGRDGKYLTHFNDKQDIEEIVQRINSALN